MDSMILNGQRNTVAEYMIFFGADNRLPMLDKDLYDSWKSIMELYMQNGEHGRMMLKSVEHANCDMKAINIILQRLPTEIYSLVNHHRVAKDLWERVQLLMQGLAIPVFSPEDDPIACLNKAMAFLTAVASSRFPSTNNQLRTSSNTRNQATIQDGRVTVQQVQRRQGQSYSSNSYKGNATSSGGTNASEQTKDLDTYDSHCDDISNDKAVLMTNISNYCSGIISEVPHSETYLNDMENQSVHAMHDFEQTPVVDFTDNEIHSDSNIILYSQYLQETQQATVQDTNLQAQQDSLILSVIEQMSEQIINHVNNCEKANKEQNNESVTAELERYKERVKTFEQRLNIDLSSREK
ncbi:hypothetical protein Tco_1576303 [Tanacetum coccineum]